MDSAVPSRKVQFVAGRVCARLVLEQLTTAIPTGFLSRDLDGCPVWPESYVGSIAHATAFATAAAAPGHLAFGLGVDVEPVMSRDVAADVAAIVATPAEMRLVEEASRLDPLAALTLVFSAKESLFKALYPPTRTHFEHLDCQIVGLDPEKRSFVIAFHKPFNAVFGGGSFSGRYEVSDGEAKTGVVLLRTPEAAART